MLDLAGLHARAAFFRCIRLFFHQQGFLEVDTPIRQPVILPESNIVPIGSEQQFLQSSPELCMKRLLAAGCSKIFQICPCFRKEEKGRLHLEEFTMLEWYRVGADYRQLMTDCKELLRFLRYNLSLTDHKSSVKPPQEFLAEIELGGRWERLTVEEAFSRYSPVSMEKALGTGVFDEMLVEHVEPMLGRIKPVFLCDYPVEFASLARKKADIPHLAERFELYINGIELANGFSELTDAREQRLRFEQERAAIKSRHGRQQGMPEKFLADLEMVDRAAGIAMGLDRLFMVGMNYQEITGAVTFGPEDL